MVHKKEESKKEEEAGEIECYEIKIQNKINANFI